MKSLPCAAALLLVAVWLSGCGGQPSTRATTLPLLLPVGEELSESDWAPVPNLQRESSLQQEPGQQLETVRRALQDRQWRLAASILRSLRTRALRREEQALWLLLQTELLHMQGATAIALTALESHGAAAGRMAPNLARQLTRWQLQLTRSHRGSLAAARLAHQLLADTSDRMRRRFLAEQIWADLNRCQVGPLRQALETARNNSWKAWLELALITARTTDSPQTQLAEVTQWRQRHPRHHAANSLPGGLDDLEALTAGYPDKIALLLPLSEGQAPAGKAVLEGFMAASFLARVRDWPALDVEVLDMADFDDINHAYEVAVSGGAQLVIGPLGAEQVRQWRPGTRLRAPLLTLNWLPEDVGGPWQLSLDAGDEARQLAQLAYDRGARRALLLWPQGDWGERTSRSLLERWTAFGGSLAAEAAYSGQDDYSNSLKIALNLADSEQRASQARQIMGESFKFSARRRQDFDVVFLLADQPRHARSIKPLLAFHYAGDLPVYSTSQAFGGHTDPQQNRDLNGLYTLASPWSLNRNGPLPSQIRRADGNPALAAWHALGADIRLLGWRMAQLAAGESHLIRGHSGLLRMERSGKVHRELVPAVVRGGTPEAY